MPERLIFHCDCNNFFASCECLERPELKHVPMAVAGDPENRVGIVVAKNEIAKQYGVKTTDTVWQARKKCPEIVFVPPRHRLYIEVSDRVNAIYRDYSDFVEPASIDESYIDLTGTLDYYNMTARELADSIRARIREEIKITISVGVAGNKIFAKMGSDYKKPDATTVILGEDYKTILWPLPVSDLMFAGKTSVKLLNQNGIHTVGDLALQPRTRVVSLLGKGGEALWMYANGLDDDPVRRWGDVPEVKSVSHGMTFRRDLVTREEIETGVAVQADRIAMSLRRQNLKGSVVSIQIKTPQLVTISRQTSLNHYTWLEHEIRDIAMNLIDEHWRIGDPIRAITVGVSKLVPGNEATEQLDLFGLLGSTGQKGSNDREKQDKMEEAADALRRKMGNLAVTLGVLNNEAIGVKREWKKKGDAGVDSGPKKDELSLKIACAEEIRKQLDLQRKRRPQMTEEDVVKFVFQGMLGVGHLIASREAALARLEEEYHQVKADAAESLTETISTDWIRLNLRPAKAKGISAEEIAGYLFESACVPPLPFTRQNVYNFCMKYNPGERMKAAAEKVLDENWLPSHSDAYRAAYHPAYRVLHRDFRKRVGTGSDGLW